MKEMSDIFEMLNSLIYVDDIFYKANSVKQAFKLNTQAHSVLEVAGMNLWQFSTNSTELRKLWDDNRIIKSDVEQNNSLKVLGFKWCINQDIISFNVDNLFKTLNSCRNITNRNILKVIASILDPVGFLSSVVQNCECNIFGNWFLILMVKYQLNVSSCSLSGAVKLKL